jgi:hypothetical protein
MFQAGSQELLGTARLGQLLPAVFGFTLHGNKILRHLNSDKCPVSNHPGREKTIEF